MTHTVAKSFALTALSIVLTACGGGSSNSGTSTTKPAEPTPVAINDANLVPVLATSLRMALDAGAGGVANQSRPESLQGTLGQGLSRALGVASSAQNHTADAATGLVFKGNQSACPLGGTAQVDITADTANTQATTVFDLVKFMVGFDFQQCRASTFTLDGNAQLQINSLLGSQANGSSLNINASLTLTDFFVANSAVGAANNAVSGKVNLALSNPNANSLDARVWLDGGSSLVYHLPGKGADFMRVESMDSHLVSNLRDATYTMQAQGSYTFLTTRDASSVILPTNKIKISTPVAFSGEGFKVPNKGVLRIEDSIAIAELRVLNDFELAYLIDDNKDGIFDRTFYSTWIQFLNAQPL